MSRSSIEGKLKGLQERFENEMRIEREGGFNNQGGIGTPRPGSGRSRPRPPLMFSNREIPPFPPRSPQATETEYRMREVYKVSGKLNVDGVEYRSHVDDLQQLGELGSGTCGHVVKMLHKPSNTVIAVKQMRRSGNSEETKRILMDLDVVVRSHDCPYIVRCLGCFVTDADVWICMELMASCFDKLLKRLGAPIPEAILGKVTVATVNALSYLKDTHGVIHRDVKPSNILLDERGNVKLCDFGISGRLVDSKAKTRSAGCAAYMAPERIDPPDPTRPDYDIRADVWSLGISLVELATGVFPYRDCQNDFEVLTRVIADDPPQLPDTDDFSPEFKLFVSQCLTKNYRQRPKYAKLLEHPFVVKSARSSISVGAWYASLSISGNKPGGVTSQPPASNGVETPVTPQPVRNFVTSSQHWMEQVTPTPARAWWATSSNASAGGSSSQPTSLETDMCNHSPYPRRRTIDACASPPPPPVRRVSADNRWRASPAAMLFYAPRWLWKSWEGGKIRALMMDLDVGVCTEIEKKTKKKLILDYLWENLRYHNWWAYRYYLCEGLALVNVIGQMFLMNRFFDGEFLTFGLDVIAYMESDQEDRIDPMIYIFPRMVKCTLFNKFGSSGEVERHDALCILPLNVVNEKIYVFLWFWFVILGILTFVTLVYRLVIIFSPRMRVYMMRMRFRLVRRDNVDTIVRRSKMGDWYLLYILGENLDSVIFRDIMHEFANKLNHNYQHHIHGVPDA